MGIPVLIDFRILDNEDNRRYPPVRRTGCIGFCQNRFVHREPFWFINTYIVTFLASRELFNTEDDINEAFADAKDEIDGFFASFWGKICVVDENCMKYVAYCDRKTGLTGVDGQCRPNIWVWLVLAGIAILLIGSCVCCLLCGLCKCIYDCLCCCCRDQGYAPANTGV